MSELTAQMNKKRRNRYLESAINSIRMALDSDNVATACSDDEDKPFCEGYSQALSEACITSIRFWMKIS